MAIKGKKKSQSRGSQARRRPAAAPRAIAVRQRTPWYRTPQGRAAIVVFLLIVIGVVTGLILHAKSNSSKLADRQDVVERYTGSVRSLLQTMTPAGSEMATAATDPNDAASILALKKSAKGWKDTLNQASDEAGTLRPPTSAATADSLFQQSVALYLSAAQLYALVPDANDATRPQLLANATTVRDQANQLWANAISTLDDLRSRLKMAPSGLRSPATAAQGAQPTPMSTTIQTGGSGNAGGNGGGGGGGKKGSKNGSK